jgi:hypothetical protein
LGHFLGCLGRIESQNALAGRSRALEGLYIGRPLHIEATIGYYANITFSFSKIVGNLDLPEFSMRWQILFLYSVDKITKSTFSENAENKNIYKLKVSLFCILLERALIAFPASPEAVKQQRQLAGST